MGTRSSWSSDDVRRGEAKNERTVVGTSLAGLRAGFDATNAAVLAPPPAFEFLFVQHYAAIREAIARHDEPGFLAMAIDARGPQGTLWLRGDGALRTGIIGRHGECDLFVPGDDAMSLRHAVVLVRDGRVRVLDLRTENGFDDESGRRLRGVVADGPLFLTLARTRVFLLPTGDGGPPWGADAAVHWAALPSRVFGDARPVAEQDGGARVPHLVRLARALRAPRADGREATITAVRGAVGSDDDFCRLAAEGDEISGHLTLTDGISRATISVGRSATERGVLLGRYDRCDVPAFVKSHEGISRVHALLIRDGDEIHLVDCASTNGIQVDGRATPCRALGHRSEILLGRSIDASWEAAG